MSDRTRWKIFLSAVLFATAVLAAGPSYACSCIQPPEPVEAVEKSTAVFVGELLRYEKSTDMMMTMTFKVLESIKGPASGEVQVTTVDSTAACGLPMTQVGAEVLLYLGGTAEALELSLCSRTTAAGVPAEELKLLRAHFGTSQSKDHDKEP